MHSLSITKNEYNTPCRYTDHHGSEWKCDPIGHVIAPKRAMVVTNEMIEDLLTGCFEGGSNYWIDCIFGDWKGKTYASDVITAGGTLEIHNGEKDEDGNQSPYTLDIDTMLDGIRDYYETMGTKAVDFENMDAGDNDNVLQFALFGELLYG